MQKSPFDGVPRARVEGPRERGGKEKLDVPHPELLRAVPGLADPEKLAAISGLFNRVGGSLASPKFEDPMSPELIGMLNEYPTATDPAHKKIIEKAAEKYWRS